MDRLKIGQVLSVSGDSVEVRIGLPDLRVHADGRMQRVGRLGSYVTLPVGAGDIIGYVTHVNMRGDLEGEGLPNWNHPVVIGVQLLGTSRDGRFSRGVNEYPTLGDDVYLATSADFRLIFGSFDQLAAGERRKSFPLGRFAIDTSFEVQALGKEFFAKHVAVMGNSGSGKSVTTAKILHEALALPHTQIILFDMHGEYLAAFSDDQGRPLPNVTYLSDRNLVLPYWMLRYEEFETLFLDASNPLNINAQKVFLRQAFELLKRPAAEELGLLAEYTIDTPIYFSLDQLKTYALNMNDARFVLNSEAYAFSRLPYRQLPVEEQEKLLFTRRMEFNKGNSEGEVPHATFFGRLMGFVNQLETRMADRRYDFLLRPFEQAQRSPAIAPHLPPDGSPGVLSRSAAAVIRGMLGRLTKQRRNLVIVDLSGLPFEVVDVVVAVLSRTLFDFNFWAPPEVRVPLVICFEEAHNYLPRVDRASRMFARDAVEKIAKEGRKYGVSAMVVTQRPSELSPTILSQCNSMVLMRMNNPDDQNYVARVVSDQFRSLISILPSMKPGEGFIIGDSVLMPMRTMMDLPPKLPRSGDVDFFQHWNEGTPDASVETIVDRWWRQTRELVRETSDDEDGTATARPGAGVVGHGGSEASGARSGGHSSTGSPAVRPAPAPGTSSGAAGEADGPDAATEPPPDACRGDAAPPPGARPPAGAHESGRGPTPAERRLAELAAQLGGKK
ncbi:MAG: DUF87 domain-containing protein [Phycisphaerales bacterium]|nr:DUF87 domain-containing protein [Phycisphaerales bacterium]